MQIVEIKWLDSKCISGWTDKDDINYPCECYSIGIVKHEDDNYLTLAIGVNDTDQYCQTTIIPKCAITNRKQVVSNIEHD